ncbi:hypothetical protein G6F65_023261 [Rhizopus arrhizus]|nr:hypothetical protein G6F65_023261 [Rhizopus arrhizus]
MPGISAVSSARAGVGSAWPRLPSSRYTNEVFFGALATGRVPALTGWPPPGCSEACDMRPTCQSWAKIVPCAACTAWVTCFQPATCSADQMPGTSM